MKQLFLKIVMLKLNTKLTIEKIDNLKYARKTCDKLSNKKLKDLLEEYDKQQLKYGLSEQRIVHMEKEEILKLNPEIANILVN